MTKNRLPIAIVLQLALLVCIATAARTQAPENQGGKSAEVQKVLDKYRSAVPAAKDLAVYQLDWLPSLKAAKEKAAKEQRPILLMVVNNSYGNLYTGHC